MTFGNKGFSSGLKVPGQDPAATIRCHRHFAGIAVDSARNSHVVQEKKGTPNKFKAMGNEFPILETDV